MKELIEEFKLNKVAYLLEIMEKKDFDSKINALKKLEKIKITPNIGLLLIENSTRNYGINDDNSLNGLLSFHGLGLKGDVSYQ